MKHIPCILALLTLADIYILPVCAAVRRPISWTQPAGATSAECIARRADGVELALTLWADSAGSAPASLPAGPARAWVLCSEDRSAWVLWVRATNSAGAGPWSNRVVVAQGLADTNWTVTRGPGALPLASYQWQRSRFGRVGFALAPGDTAALQIVSQEAVQRAASARLVQEYGYWMLRGQPVTVPDNDPSREE